MGLPEAMQCYLKLLVLRLLAFDSSRSEFSHWPRLPLVTPKQVGSSARYLARQAAKSLQHGGCVEAVRSLARRLPNDCARGLQSLHLSTDDTPIQVMDTAHPKGIKRGNIWSFVSDDKIVFFEYTPNWQGAHVQELLKDFQGTLQSDGYAGLGGLFQKKGAPKRAGCLAHARRKFVAAFKAGDLRAARTLQLIQELYQVERRANEDNCDSHDRLRRRQESSAPRMQQLRMELDSLGR